MQSTQNATLPFEKLMNKKESTSLHCTDIIFGTFVMLRCLDFHLNSGKILRFMNKRFFWYLLSPNRPITLKNMLWTFNPLYVRQNMKITLFCFENDESIKYLWCSWSIWTKGVNRSLKSWANRYLLTCSIPKVELSQISRTTRQKRIKICENLRQGNSNYHKRLQGKHANISAKYNDLKFMAIFDLPIDSGSFLSKFQRFQFKTRR